MARLNITLDQDEIFQLLEKDTGDAFRKLLQETLNTLMRTESREQLRADPYQRTAERTDSRNGSRERELVTRIGRLELKVPRHRNVPFRTLVFDNYSRSEAALVTTMAEMVVAGVSTAKVGRVMEEICGRSFSKQAVSEACSELDGAVEEFRTRPIESECLFVSVDATYVKARENHRVVSKALMIAMALRPDGRKEIVGFDVADREEAATWESFLRSLKSRGMSGVRMFTSDEHKGIVSALERVYPDVPWQRCQAHFARNIAEAAPKRLRVGLRSELAEMFNCDTLEEAMERRDEIIADYSGAARHGVPRRRLQRCDDGDGPAARDEEADPHVELPRAAERRGEEALEGRRGLPQREVRGEAARRRAHGDEREVGDRAEALLLEGGRRARGNGEGIGADSEGAERPEECGLGGAEDGGWSFTRKNGLDCWGRDCCA
jgi:transposase-like protein